MGTACPAAPASPGAGPAPAQGDSAASTDPQGSTVRCAAPQPSPQLQAPPFPAASGASLESTSPCPSTASRMPKGSDCSRKAQHTQRQDQEALRSFMYSSESGSVTALVTQHQTQAPGKWCKRREEGKGAACSLHLS